MDNNRLIAHVRKTLAHTLSQHQYGVVDDEKNTSIVKTLSNYLQGLHDANIIEDYVLSVVNISDDHISASIAIKHLKGSEFVVFPSELYTRFKDQHEDDFDRAMEGV